MTALAALAGASMTLGLLIVIVAVFWPDTLAVNETRPTKPKRTTVVDRLPARFAAATIAAVAVALFTHWPVATIAAAIGGLVAPSYRQVKRSRSTALARTDAVAAWIEMLRDTMAGAAGLHEAITSSARVAPAAIREEVMRLAARSEHRPLPEALRQFAAEVDDPVADSVVAALILTVEHQAGSLSNVLTQIAGNAREQAAMRLRVEASRSRTYVTVQFIVGVTLAMAVGLIVFARTYLAPFDTLEGQLAMIVIVGLFGGAAYGVQHLGRPAPIARLYNYAEGTP